MCSERHLRLVAVALVAAALWGCARPTDPHDLSATIASVEPACGDTAHPTAIVLRGSFPADPQVSFPDPADDRLDTTYRAWLGDVELLGVTWQDPGALAATVPASFVAGVYPLTVEGPWHERVTAPDGFEMRPGGCSGTPGALALTASVAPNAVTVGQPVTVTATVRNTGQHTVFDVDAAVSVAPAGVTLTASDTGPRDVAGGASTTFTWSYDTTAVTGPEGASFVLTAGGVDDLAGAVVAQPATTNTLLVNTPANVTAATEAPATVDPEQVITFTLRATNTGAAPALVSATLTRTVNGSATVRTLSSPTAQNVPAQSERALVWEFSANGPCEIILSVTVTATDLNSGRALTVAPTPPVTVTVQRAAALATTVAVAPLVTATQTLTVTATVTNGGQATATGVSATVAAAPAMFTLVTNAGGPQTIAGGASATFTWVYRAGVGASRGTFAIDAAGVDANAGAPLAAPRATSAEVVVAYPIGGTVSGLARSGLVLRNGSENLTPSGDGAFTFPTAVANGATYSVGVVTQPLGLTCSVANGSGTVGTAPVTGVAVTCATNAYTLTATVSPAGGGTLSCDGGACQASYAYSTTPITVTAAPSPGYAFASWSGDCTGSGACTVTMTANRTVTANFTGLTYALSATASPPGGGTLSCGGAPCQASYAYSTTPMTVTAVASPGYVFASWSGDCTGTGACSVTMTANHSVVANFTLLSYTLLTFVNPAGAGTLSCGGAPCQASYAYSTTPLAITATPAPGYAFASWSGDCTGTGACSVTMTTSHSVTATFTPLSYLFVAGIAPLGSGSLLCDGTACLASYPYSTTPMQITAVPAQGYVFKNWSGDCTGSGDCTVTMTANHDVTAHFDARTYRLSTSVRPPGGGTLACDGGPCLASYPAMTTVEITATPADGYAFGSWSGDCSGAGACLVTMDQDRAVTADFTLTTAP